ncbi:MAG: RNA methyltransferase [Rikenellaceae bacterium]
MIKSEIQFVRSLSDKRAREESRLFIAEGDKLISEIAESKLKLRKLYITSESGLEGIEPVEYVGDKEMERISQLKTANCSLALVEIPQHRIDIDRLKDKLTIVLDGVQNPGNLGTIIRLADWFGVENIICSPNCADCYSPKVVQATMGAILRVAIHYIDVYDTLSKLKELNVPIYGTLLEGESIYNAPLTKEGVIVMGSEGQGVSAEVQRLFDHPLFIPPYPADNQSSESLNVAIATSIVCSEFRRR